MSLQDHIAMLSQHGTSRAVSTLTGEDIPVEALCKALNERIKYYVPADSHRIAWFKTTQGLVVMVAGDWIVTQIFAKFLATYKGGCLHSSEVMYSGRGVQVFKQAVNAALADYMKCRRSFGASR